MAAKGIFNGVVEGSENLIAPGFCKITDFRFHNKSGSPAIVYLIVGEEYSSGLLIYKKSIAADAIDEVLETGTLIILGPGQNLYADVSEPGQEVYMSVGGLAP